MDKLIHPFKRKKKKQTHCNISEAMSLLSCSRRTIYNRFEKKLLTKIILKGSNKVYIKISEIDKYLNGNNIKQNYSYDKYSGFSKKEKKKLTMKDILIKNDRQKRRNKKLKADIQKKLSEVTNILKQEVIYFDDMICKDESINTNYQQITKVSSYIDRKEIRKKKQEKFQYEKFQKHKQKLARMLVSDILPTRVRKRLDIAYKQNFTQYIDTKRKRAEFIDTSKRGSSPTGARDKFFSNDR